MPICRQNDHNLVITFHEDDLPCRVLGDTESTETERLALPQTESDYDALGGSVFRFNTHFSVSLGS